MTVATAADAAAMTAAIVADAAAMTAAIAADAAAMIAATAAAMTVAVVVATTETAPSSRESVERVAAGAYSASTAVPAWTSAETPRTAWRACS